MFPKCVDVEIDHCEECPFFRQDLDYDACYEGTGDCSVGDPEYCGDAGISYPVDTPPDWCPLRCSDRKVRLIVRQ